jgi:glycosyltransferase involved in cell wall biosynthesis
MRILVCRHRRAPPDEALEEFSTALLQEGHEVRTAARGFTPDLVIERYAPGHLAGAWFARRRGVRYCVLVDAPPRRPAPLLERMIWRTADRVLAATAALREEIAALGVDPEHIDIVPGGVVPERFLPAPFAPDRASGAVVLGWIGGGQAPMAIAAPGLLLIVIADVPPARVPDLLAGIDIALVSEPAPLRLLDCMAAGRAIVAPDCPELRELLEHERTALLFDPAEAGALARAAARLIADAPLRARLGEAARAELARRDLSWRSLARRLAGDEVAPPT